MVSRVGALLGGAGMVVALLVDPGAANAVAVAEVETATEDGVNDTAATAQAVGAAK